MSCGLTDQDSLTLTEEIIESVFDPTGGLRHIPPHIPIKPGRYPSPDVAKFISSYREHRELNKIPFKHFKLSVHMYMCPRCNPFNQKHDRFIEIKVSVKKDPDNPFYRFGYFKSEDYKTLFFQLNPERIPAPYTLTMEEDS